MMMNGEYELRSQDGGVLYNQIRLRFMTEEGVWERGLWHHLDPVQTAAKATRYRREGEAGRERGI